MPRPDLCGTKLRLHVSKHEDRDHLNFDSESSPPATNGLQATSNCYYSCTALIQPRQSLPAVKRVFLYGNAVFLEE
jgi:hypothetical protein